MNAETEKKETLAELEAKVAAIKVGEYLAELDTLKKHIDERARYYTYSPRKVVEDLGRKFQKYTRVTVPQDNKEAANS